MENNSKLLVRGLLALILAGCAVALASNADFYAGSITSAFFSIALGSTVILHLSVRPKWADVLLILVCSAVLAVLEFSILKFTPRFMVLFSLLGMSSLLILGIRTIWAEGEERRFLLCAFVPALLFVSSEWMASSLLDFTETAHPKTLDLYLYSFDASLHVQLSFLMGVAFLKWAWLRTAGILFYLGLPIPIALVYAGQLIRQREKALPVMLAFLITGPLGVLFYNLYPATGPIHVFKQGFPFHPLPISQAARLLLEPIAIPGPRNAIPSLHMAWVLLAWWYSRKLSWPSRGIVMAFVVFTVLATLGTGEHYFVDLIVAFPFALMIQGLCSLWLPWRKKERLLAVLFGGLGTLAWLAMLRFAIPMFWTSPVVPWAIAGATIALTEIRRIQLQQAEDSQQEVVAAEELVAAVGSEEAHRAAV